MLRGIPDTEPGSLAQSLRDREGGARSWRAGESLGATVVAALLVGACGASAAPARSISVVARDIAYEPTRIGATVGEPVEIALRNVGAIDHDLNVAGIAVRDVQARDALPGAHGHAGATAPVHVAAGPGRTATVRFVPEAAGTFDVWCSVPGHREAGMVATLEVRARER